MSSLLQPVATVTDNVDWVASTDVTPEHTAERAGADKVYAALVGSKVIIEKTKGFLKTEKQLDDVTARQLRKLLLSAAENPGTIPEVVGKRVEAEARLSSVLDSYTFCLQPKVGGGGGGGCLKPVSANGIDDLLLKSRDLAERQRVWTASKEIGRPLKPGLVELVKLRNQVAREMGYKSYFALKVADYGMTVDEMMTLLDDTLATTKPLFDGLHCWAKNALAARYKRPAPKLIPAHWIGNRWAQYWPGLVEEASLDPLFKGASPESIVKSAENFYVSLGFPRLPPTFWEKSDLYPVPPGLARKKNAHASAWHIDYDRDVRSLMSVEANEQWFGTAHHELGHIYYYLSYSTPEVPFLLREGANRAFHEAVGELAKLASEQTPYLVKVGVMPAGKEPEPGGLAAAVGAHGVDRVHVLLGRHHEPLRTRPVRRRAAARRVAEALVGLRRAVPGRRRAGRPPGRPVRRLHQDAHQRRPAQLLRLRAGDAHQVPAARPHLHEDPQAGRARLRLLRQQGGGRLPARHPLEGARRATGAPSSRRRPASRSRRAP